MSKNVEYPDNINQFKIGVVVRHTAAWRSFYGNMPGHVVGFALNSSHEVVVDVKWADGTTKLSHPHNIELV